MTTHPALSLRRAAAGLLLPALMACVATLGSGCTEDESHNSVTSSAGEAAESDPEAIRTADPYARGYTDEDFPRVKELAPGVFTYEQLRSAGEERFTTVSFFVPMTSLACFAILAS